MKTMTLQRIAVLFCQIAMAVPADGQELSPDEARQIFKNLETMSEKEKTNWIQKTIDKMPYRTVYIKVEDDKGNPLTDADVVLKWRQASTDYQKERYTIYTERGKTDVSGRVKFTCEKICDADADASKSGYVRVTGGRSTMAVTSLFNPSNLTAEEKPARIIFRKKYPSSFLLTHPTVRGGRDGWFGVRSANITMKTFDILSLVGAKMSSHDISNRMDLRIEPSLDETTGIWFVRFSATNNIDGLILSDDKLFEAPESGYEHSVILEIPLGHQNEKMLYLRGKNPLIFSRAVMYCRNQKEIKSGNLLSVNFEICINPYGGRTFEYDERYDNFWREKPQWVEDAKAALREGRYPERIDIDALIKAEQETGKK
jgi:hypothetical protein